MDCAYLNKSDDCGLYAIANTVAEAFGTDPTTEEYDTELMGGHLIHCRGLYRGGTNILYPLK